MAVDRPIGVEGNRRFGVAHFTAPAMVAFPALVAHHRRDTNQIPAPDSSVVVLVVVVRDVPRWWRGGVDREVWKR